MWPPPCLSDSSSRVLRYIYSHIVPHHLAMWRFGVINRCSRLVGQADGCRGSVHCQQWNTHSSSSSMGTRSWVFLRLDFFTRHGTWSHDNVRLQTNPAAGPRGLVQTQPHVAVILKGRSMFMLASSNTGYLPKSTHRDFMIRSLLRQIANTRATYNVVLVPAPDGI
jgi:hypothetical protein